MSNLSKHAFGSEANVDAALAKGAIDAFDILFLDEGKIGWIDENGQKVILEDKKQVMPVESLPETGDPEILYIYNSKFYFWNGTEFASPSEQSVDEATIDTKIAAAKQEVVETANTYTDKQIEAAIAVIEF